MSCAGPASGTKKVFVVEHHDQVLHLWCAEGLTRQKVAHVDFHCDMRGMLIDRARQQAFRIWDRFSQLDEGNYLAFAILEGIVDDVRWIHDDPGGRAHDIKSVKYTSDLSAVPHRLALRLAGRQGVPIRYDVQLLHEWAGPREGEILDIDWDCLVSQEYPHDSVQQRVADFLARDFRVIPDHTYLCYSPGYSHPTRGLFRSFAGDLAARFGAELVVLPIEERASESLESKRKVFAPLYRAARHLYHHAAHALRQRGIY